MNLLLPVRSHREVARLLGISRQAVSATERRALAKVRRLWLARYGPALPRRAGDT